MKISRETMEGIGHGCVCRKGIPTGGEQECQALSAWRASGAPRGPVGQAASA